MDEPDIPFTRICCRRPRAQDFIDTLYDLPKELLPQYWFQLEPRPKSKRVYLEKDRQKYIDKMMAFCVHGSLHHEKYQLNADGFLGPNELHPEELVFFSFYLGETPKKKYGPEGPSKDPVPEVLAVADHFTRGLDTHWAIHSTHDACSALDAARVNLLVSTQTLPEGFEPQWDKAACGFEYPDCKVSFPGLGWKTVLSEELLEDYKLSAQDFAAQAVATREMGESSSGKLTEYTFFEHPSGWQDHIDRLAALCHRADLHHLEVPRYRAEIGQRRWHRVQEWDNWISDGKIIWPGPAED